MTAARTSLPPNLLCGRPLPEAPDRVWAGDITFIPSASGWLYLAVVIDLCSRRIVGWSLADHLRADLVLHALQQALQTRSPRGAIFHSDRGSQYGSTLFRKALARAGLLQSMSSRANPYENAWTESFIGTLKHEMLQGGCNPSAGGNPAAWFYGWVEPGTPIEVYGEWLGRKAPIFPSGQPVAVRSDAKPAKGKLPLFTRLFGRANKQP